MQYLNLAFTGLLVTCYIVNDISNLMVTKYYNFFIIGMLSIVDPLTDRYLDVGEWACVSR